MREILFRGKRCDNCEWIVGHLIRFEGGRARINESHTDVFCHEKDDSIIQTVAHEVYPFTVGQYTELTDVNGKKIFEGDIVHVHDRLLRCDAPYHEFDGVIAHRNASFVIVDDFLTHYRWLDYDVTVIGNIHDNPELLEGE